MSINSLLAAHLEVSEAQADYTHAVMTLDLNTSLAAKARLAKAVAQYDHAYQQLSDYEVQALATAIYET
jgi:hypothetical protein